MNNEAIENLQSSFDEMNPNGGVRQLQLVRAGSVQFGIYTDEIATIVAWRKPTPLPHAPKTVLGVVSIQGRMLTVLELTTLVGTETAASNSAPADNRHLIALRGDEQLALAVVELGEIVEISGSALSSRSETAGAIILGVLRLADSEINILDLKELFPTAIQDRLRRRRRF